MNSNPFQTCDVTDQSTPFADVNLCEAAALRDAAGRAFAQIAVDMCAMLDRALPEQ